MPVRVAGVPNGRRRLPKGRIFFWNEVAQTFIGSRKSRKCPYSVEFPCGEKYGTYLPTKNTTPESQRTENLFTMLMKRKK